MVFAPMVYQEKLCDNYLSVRTKNRVSDVNCLNSDCKGWDITGFKQYIVLKAPFFGAHPQSKFLDSLQRMDETNLVRIPDCIPTYSKLD